MRLPPGRPLAARAAPLAAASAVLAALLAPGCAGVARLVVVEPGGGVVAVPWNAPRHREAAAAVMARQCPGGYEVAREEEAVVGTTVTAEAETERDRVRKERRTTLRTVTEQKTEWRITFRCRRPERP